MDDGLADRLQGLQHAEEAFGPTGGLHAAPVSARIATLLDTPSVTAIHNQAVRDRSAGFLVEPRSPGQVASWIASDRPVIVACLPSGEIVAFAAALESEERAASPGIISVCAAARRDWQGRGLDVVALGALVEAACEKGFWKLVARILPEDLAARTMLRLQGFKEVGVLEQHIRLDGVWRDCLMVERLLPQTLA